MAEKKDPKSPATTSDAYDQMAPKWAKIQTVLDGTEAMRDANEAYLPRHDNESESVYEERLNGNVLRNVTAQTLESWVGKPFSNPISLGEDIPAAIKEHLDDIDLQGNAIGVFARDWLREGLAKGLCPVLVDYPRTAPEVGAPPRTMEDDIREGVRPYWIRIAPENVIAAYGEIRDGVDVLTHLRLREEITLRDGFAEVTIPRIRVFDLVPVLADPQNPETSAIETRMQVEIWEERQIENSRKKRWVPVESWVTGMKRIPFPIFYAGERKALMVTKPVMEDLVDLNIRHWQSNSDQITILTVTRFPILALSGGAPEDDELTIGPRQWLYCADARGRFYYVEHTGAALKAGADDLADLIEQMADYGAEFLKRRPTNTPATSRLLDSSEATSPLQDAVIRFTDAIAQALDFHAEWMNLPDGGSITFSTEFGPSGEQSTMIGALQTMRRDRDISRPQYLKRMQQLGALPDNFDFDENDDQLEEEAREAMTPKIEIDKGAPPAGQEDANANTQQGNDAEAE